MATFVVTKDVNFVLGGFEFHIDQGSASCPDDLLDEIIALVGDGFIDSIQYDRSRLGGVIVSGTPEAGDVVTASSSSAATWAPPNGGVTDHGDLDGLADNDHPQYTTDAEATVIADVAVATHTSDSTDAHDASSISVLDTAGNFTGTDVEAVLAELDAAIAAGTITVEEGDGAPSVADVDTIIFDEGDFTVTDNSDGSVTIASLGGGGGTGNVIAQAAGDVEIHGLAGSADRIPASPDADDDEFNNTDTSDPMTGWTTLGTPTAHDINSTALSHYYLTKAAAAGIHVCGIYKARTPPFTVTCHLADGVVSEGSGRAALMVGAATPGAMVSVGWAGVPAGSGFNNNASADAWTNPTTFGSVLSGAGAAPGARYFRIVVASSTDVTLYVSRTGKAGSWWVVGTANFNPGFTVGCAGLIVNRPASGVAAQALFDWLRFT